MQRTISVKLSPPKGFLAFMEKCNLIANLYIDWCFENKTYNKAKAHASLYEQLRLDYPEIPSGLIQTIRDVSLESVKRDKLKIKPVKNSHSAIRYDKRTMALRGNLLTFSWTGDRIKQIISIPKYFKKYVGWSFQGGTICYDGKNFSANLCFETGTPPVKQVEDNNKIVGIDRGLYNIVTLSDGMKYNAKLVRRKKRQYLHVERQLQAKGTPSSRKKLKKRSGKEKRFSSNINHIISKQLVNLPYDIFVLEDLTGIRKKRKGKKLNGWISNWTFYQLEQYLIYKAEALGKQVVKVNASYTSQRCNNCRIIEKSNRNKSKYICSKCGYVEHADINAAKNIKTNYLLSITERSVEQAVCQSAECFGKPETSLCL